MAPGKLEQVKQIADAVMYEGYVLYPYRPSALKNQRGWLFGRVYPRAYSESRGGVDAWFMQTECLLFGNPTTLLDVRVRFLQLTGSQPEAVEREVVVADLPLAELLSRPHSATFAFGASPAGQNTAGRCPSRIEGVVELSAGRVGGECCQLTVRVLNHTAWGAAADADEDVVLPHTLVSAHAILGVRDGKFVSLLDPPEPLRALAAGCRNVGAWPVLVGDEGDRGTMLAAPIILYDYPKVAPESPGDFFDGTEMDEMLTLRVLTLTEEEKREVRAAGSHALALLERTEGLSGDEILRLHGAVRDQTPPQFRPGTRVRLRPRSRSDAMDVILNGMTATVVSVEHDFEGRVHLAVTIDDDPGQDLGRQGQPGHRFFFYPEDVEALAADRGGSS